MKTYFLALNNSDFAISGKTWTSSSFDLYSNRFYTNYSTYRSPYGLNELGNYTFVGTEVSSPNYATSSATPTLNNAYKVTNYGEVVRDPDWTPYYLYNYDQQVADFFLFDLENPDQSILNPDQFVDSYLRFVDTSSQIDLVGYKHSFTNLPGLENPTFSLKILSSDNPNATDSEWQQIAFVESNNNVLFLTNIKRYLKVIINFVSDSDLDDANFLLLMQMNIAEIVSPVITDHARNVLSRFPSWTKMYSDSLERATPEIALPESQAGKIINSVLGEDLDKVDELVSEIEINSFISTADVNQVAWTYVATNVRPGFIKVVGDGLELARVASYTDLFQTSFNEYVFYYDFVAQRLITIRPFITLEVDGDSVEQIPFQNFNSFDELGLRVGLQRLYLENNLNFKKRILDVYLNPPSVDVEGLKRTLRRELDIWRAFGSTPDSNYVGATPEIIEISEIAQASPRYSDFNNNPTQDFRNFVEDINTRFPSNIGYAKWGETYWDYAGSKQEGVSSISQIADAATVDSIYYQPGVGDFDDAKLILEKLEQDINEYSFELKIKGIKSDSTELAKEPIKVEYDSYVSYYEDYIDNGSATINYEVALTLQPHGIIETTSTYSANLVDVVNNTYDQNSPASPEYIYRDIFGPTLFSDSSIVFANQEGNPYQNTIEVSATESYNISQIPFYAVNQMQISFFSASNQFGATGNYGWIRFAGATPSNIIDSTPSTVSRSITTVDPLLARLQLSSRIWDPVKRRISETERVRSSAFGNTVNKSNKLSETNDVIIYPSDIKNNFLLPNKATPIYVHIDNVVSSDYDVDNSSAPYVGYGGVSVNRQENLTHLIPSSPSLLLGFVNANFATPDQHNHYVGVEGSTHNYYFVETKFPYNATPDFIKVYAPESGYYPFEYKVWENFEATHYDEFSFYLSEQGVVGSSPDSNYDNLQNKKTDLVGEYTLYRSDFGLEEYEEDENLIVRSVEILHENDNVYIWQDNSNDTTGIQNLNFYDEELDQIILKDIKIRAQYISAQEEKVIPSIKTGWYYQDGEAGFIYAKSVVESWNTDDSHDLSSVVRNGAPAIVTVQASGSTPVQYRQVSFFDEATPSQYSLYNFEYITAKNKDYLLLAYSDYFDATVEDTHTGATVVSGLGSITNILEQHNSFVVGRNYRVSYRVRNAFVLDNQIYDNLTDSYRSRITLSSTPNGTYSATVNYESSIYDRDYELDGVYLNPLYGAVDEGYLYLSHSSYTANSVDAFVSPAKLLSDGNDYIVLNIFSKDTNSNPKPNQTFAITGTQIASDPQYVTTDKDGFGFSKVSYSGSPTSVSQESSIYITGLSSPNVFANENSESNLISATVNYWLMPSVSSSPKILAQTTKKIITANSTDSVEIYGKSTPNSYVYWRKARNLPGVFVHDYSDSLATPGQSNVAGAVQADSAGMFKIGPFVAQNDATPGYWYVGVESDMLSVLSAEPVTIAGDIVYWYEKYDASQANSEEPVYIPRPQTDAEYVLYDEDPVFKTDEIGFDVFYDSNATPSSYDLPVWYPIDRFTQYKIGLLGSTPNTAASLNDLHPDFEED